VTTPVERVAHTLAANNAAVVLRQGRTANSCGNAFQPEALMETARLLLSAALADRRTLQLVIAHAAYDWEFTAHASERSYGPHANIVDAVITYLLSEEEEQS